MLSLPVLLLPRQHCRESSFSFYLSLSRPSVNSFSFLSFHCAANRHGQFSRPRSRAAIRKRARQKSRDYSTDGFQKFSYVCLAISKSLPFGDNFNSRPENEYARRLIRPHLLDLASLRLFPVSKIETDTDADK